MKDPVLNRVLDNASSAGIKTSAAGTMKVAAARALLTKLAEQVDSEKKAKAARGKEKESMMGGGGEVGGSSQAARGGTPVGIQQPQFTQ